MPDQTLNLDSSIVTMLALFSEVLMFQYFPLTLLNHIAGVWYRNK